ncbi:chitin deacetylase [Aspergillus affinis]|uniref:chitin deacetylase n=1 Tax=Aspergillus affinis TaxID=1070780 RepID=UPI0022FEE3CE|nr:polysaccharide deacetylase family protein [Aspergillus affinis]KAI9037898.1 polysaccharide deacetylase family protein [Aspergillus affinis]
MASTLFYPLSILTLFTLLTSILASPMMIMTVHPPRHATSNVSFESDIPIYAKVSATDIPFPRIPTYQNNNSSTRPKTPHLPGHTRYRNDTTTETVPVGTMITDCAVPGTIALTYDDGPSHYTPKLLDVLLEYDVRATFFVNGYHLQHEEYTEYLKRASEEGHQIASHTYDHPQLPSLDYDGIYEQMTRLSAKIRDITGRAPTYMRPPYLEVNDLVLSVLGDLGYRVISASIDTKDYKHDTPWLIDHSYERFVEELEAGGTIVLAHDTHRQTVETLTREMLEGTKLRGLKAVTVGECLGESERLWYR